MRGGLTCLLLMWFVLSGSAQYQFVKQWDYRYGGDGFELIYCSFLQTKDGGYLLGGSSASDVSGDKTQPNWNPNLMSTDFWIVRLDHEGHKLWDRRYGGSGTDGLYALQQTTDGGFIMGGPTFSSISNGDITDYARGDVDYWVIKVDSVGNKLWDKRFGGNMYDELYSIAQTHDGGYILGGLSESGISGDKTEPLWNLGGWPYSDGWVIKIDSLGNKQWDKSFGCYKFDAVRCILPTSDGGYLLGARSNSGICGDKSEDCFDPSHSLNDYWVIKIDSLGNQLWDKIYGGTGGEGLFNILPCSDGNYLLGGGSASDSSGVKTMNKTGSWLVKITGTGSIIWQTVYYGGQGYVNMTNTIDNGFLLSGEYSKAGLNPTDNTEVGLGETQTWVLKLDSSGSKEWDKMIFSPGPDLQGFALQTIDGCYAVESYSFAGIGGYKTQAAYDSSFDYWILKFCMEEYNSLDHGQQPTDNSLMQVWPNPFNTDLSLTLSKGEGIIPAATFTITSLTGQIVYQQQETNLAPGYTKMLDLHYLPNGVYFVEVSTEQGKAVKRVVKE